MDKKSKPTAAAKKYQYVLVNVRFKPDQYAKLLKDAKTLGLKNVNNLCKFALTKFMEENNL